MVKKKKMLTVEDLYKFCLETNFAKFSAKESGYQLAVQVPTTFEIDDASDDNHRGMMRLKFRILHDGKNRNGSFVSHKSAVKASNTIADRPIMAAIHQLDDGSWDFKSHEMEIVENEDGELEVNYIEKQVGSFSSEKPFWEHDDEYDKDYLCAYGYIAEEYTKAADIIRNKGWTKNSCELVIEEMSFNAKEKQLELNEFYLSASTLLGCEDDGTPIGEGMLGSRADIADFSVKNNSVFSQNDKVIKLLSELNEKLDGLNIDQNLRKEETMKDNFEEKTEEEIKDSPSVEVFDGEEPGEVDYYEEPGEEGGDDDNPTPNPELEPTPDPTPDPELGDDEDDDDEQKLIGNDDTAPRKKVGDFSVSITQDDKVHTFSVSLQDKIDALYTLVNDLYSDQDAVWYDVDVYDDDKYIVMHSWWSNNAYKQNYKVKKDVYSLVGDRIPVKAVWCTEDEQKALENMKANYYSIEEKLANYEAEPEKLNILNSECYSKIVDTEEFKELSKRDTYFEMSIEDVQSKADEILLSYAKKSNFALDSTEPKKVGLKRFVNPYKNTSKRSRYGGLGNK